MDGTLPDEAARENAVLRSGILRRARDPDLARIVSLTAAYYDATFAGLSIITGRRQVLLARVGTEVLETPREESFCQFTIQRPGEPLIVPDATTDKRFAKLATVSGDPHVRFYAGFPIADQNGYPLGALCVGDNRPRAGPFDTTTLRIRALEVESLLRR